MSATIPDQWLKAIVSWASENEWVDQMYVFGSRVTGRNRPDSDLDVAICIRDGDETPLTIWICESQSWRQELRNLRLPVPIDLQLAQQDDTIVWPAVQQHGLLIYDRT